MKKFCSVFLSIILFVSCFCFLDLRSFADDSIGDYRFNTNFVYRYDPNGQWVEAFSCQQPYNVALIRVASATQEFPSPGYYVVTEPYVVNYHNGVTSSSSETALTRWYYEPHGEMPGIITPSDFSESGYGTSPQWWRTLLLNYDDESLIFPNAMVFNSLSSAYDYLETGDTSGLVAGEDNVPGSSLDWGENGIPEQGGSIPDTYNIPAPQFEPVYDANGNITHSIKFTNQWIVGPGQGDRGIVMKASFSTVTKFKFSHSSVFTDVYKIGYENMVDGDIFTIFARPSDTSEIVPCPKVFNFDTNEACLDAFSDFLEEYPVNNRTYEYSTIGTAVGLETRFKAYLSDISCPYNAIAFSCYYYQVMPDGTYRFGPSTTGSFGFPPQFAGYDLLSVQNTGGMDSGSGGGLSASDGSGWSIDYGNGSTVYNGGNVDVNDVKQNLQSLFGFMGEMPQFVSQVFQFLPPWLIAFIAVAIALMVAIGIIKTLVG